MLRFFRDFFIYGFASILGKLAAVFLMPVYTNVLTCEEYGAMALITSIKGIIDLFSNLNIHSGIAREYNETGVNRTKLVSTGFFSILGISLSVMLIMIFSQSFWQERVLSLDNTYSKPFLLMLLTIPAGSALSYFSVLTRFKRKPILYSIGTIIQLLIQISISIVGVVVLHYGIASLFFGILCGELFGIIYFSFINRSHISLTFDAKYLKRALIFSIPTLPAILAGWVDSSMGQIVIGKYISNADLAVYSVALQLASVFTFISVALQNVWGPYLYENYMKEGFSAEVNQIYKTIVVVLLIMAVVISSLSNELVLLLTNVSYIRAASYLTILCIPMCIYLLFPIAASGIHLSRDTKYIGLSYILGSLSNILFMALLIKLLGIIAVPLSLAISRLTTYSIMCFMSTRKGFDMPSQRLLFVSIVCVLICYVCVNLHLSLITRLLVMTLIVGPAIVYLLKVINIKKILVALRKR